MQRALLTGVTGYIGGSLAGRLRDAGYAVTVIVRDPAAAARQEASGLRPVIGGLDDAGLLTRLAGEAELVVNTADSDHRGAVEALLAGLRGRGGTLVHTSGSSIVADEGTGAYSERVFADDDEFTPIPAKVGRVAIDRLVRAAQGVRGIVVCPTMIYGRGLGSKRDSIQVPTLIAAAKRRGAGVHIGAGRNLWSNVHIEDLVDLYMLVIDRAPAGSFYFAENGETALYDVAAAIGRMLGFPGPTQVWPLAEAGREIGVEAASLGLASNSRVRATHARALGWRPHRVGILAEIEAGSYREDFGPR